MGLKNKGKIKIKINYSKFYIFEGVSFQIKLIITKIFFFVENRKLTKHNNLFNSNYGQYGGGGAVGAHNVLLLLLFLTLLLLIVVALSLLLL